MAKGSKGEKELKRRVVAKGIVQGKSTRAIAQEAGCAPRHVARLAEEPATEFLITEIMRPHFEKLSRMAKTAIDACDTALRATQKGCLPDHDVRLRAVQRYRDLAEMAQGKASNEQEAVSGLLTWEEFEVLYRKRTIHAGSDPTQPAPLA